MFTRSVRIVSRPVGEISNMLCPLPTLVTDPNFIHLTTGLSVKGLSVILPALSVSPPGLSLSLPGLS